ncbi:MAG: type IV toxin-antitoxin system AbiEi family antitoxin domain-containing protein [Actinomycetota bacterium]|nr:type IV toxin-antitoxin system AbiEi family antitoxin domain-containing protein [Actinomycetota bacterium]
MSRLAAKQLGLLLRAQLLALGVTRRQVDTWLLSGLLVPVFRGVYRVGAAPPTSEQRLMAACLAAGPTAVVSHRAAANLWQLRGIDSAPVEILLPGPRRPQLDHVIVHRTLDLHRADATRRGVIPITAPARTLCDLAAVVDIETLESAAEDALLIGLVSWDRLLRVGERLAGRGRPGSGALLEMLRERGPEAKPTESPLEDEMVRLLRRAGLPEPRRQIPIRVPGHHKTVYVDLGYSPVKLALEGDSRRWHGARRDVQRNSVKANLIVAAGWRALHFTRDDVRQRPDYLVGCVRQELHRQAS